MEYIGRTDLATEAHKFFLESGRIAPDFPGLMAKNEKLFNMDIYSVQIESQEAAEKLGKPIGKYYTLSLPKNFNKGSQQFTDCAKAISQLILRCFQANNKSKFSVAALGNPDMTPDALGNLCASYLLVTRHLKNRQMPEFEAFGNLSVIRPGVLGTSGIESAEQIKSILSDIEVDCLIAVDALAGAELEGLCSSVQISSAGIAPGSGVGNSRQELSQGSMGVPVVAIGVPTVIDASNFLSDEGFQGLFVTDRNIDSQIRSLARLIGFGINFAVHPKLSYEDFELLLG